MPIGDENCECAQGKRTPLNCWSCTSLREYINEDKMFKKNQKVKVMTGPAEGKVGKIKSYDKDHPSGMPWFVQSDKILKEDDQVMGRFFTSELAPIIRTKKADSAPVPNPTMPK